MSNGVHPHVPRVHLKDDDSVDVVVEIVGFSSGNWAEISGYIIQEDTIQGSATLESSVFIPFSAIRQVPDSLHPGVTPTVTVNVPGLLPLNPGADVKVIVRVTEAQIWPTRLELAEAALTTAGVKLTWEAKTGPTSLLTSIYPVQNPAQQTPGPQTFTVPGPNGSTITITVGIAAPG